MRAYLYARRRVIAAFLLFAAVFGVVFWLGGVPMGARSGTPRLYAEFWRLLSAAPIF